MTSIFSRTYPYWKYLGIMVGILRKKNISTQSELIKLVNQEWEKIDQEQIDNRIDSMSGRITEWIDHDRDRIKY